MKSSCVVISRWGGNLGNFLHAYLQEMKVCHERFSRETTVSFSLARRKLVITETSKNLDSLGKSRSSLVSSDNSIKLYITKE